MTHDDVNALLHRIAELQHLNEANRQRLRRARHSRELWRTRALAAESKLRRWRP